MFLVKIKRIKDCHQLSFKGTEKVKSETKKINKLLQHIEENNMTVVNDLFEAEIRKMIKYL